MNSESKADQGGKPLAKWTLESVKKECESRDEHCHGCPFTTNAGCRISCASPNLWDLTEKPRFTEDEVATMRVLYAAGARYVARDENNHVYWFENRPDKDKLGIYVCLLGNLAALPESMLSSIFPGQSIEIKDIIGQ